YVGRWDRTDPSVFHSYWTGAYLRVGFTGTSAKIKLAAGTNLSVSIDGEPLRDVNAGAGVTDLAAGPLAPGAHTLLAASQGQNFEIAFQGLVLEAGAETRPTPARPIVEFVGDSISAGVNGNYCWQTGEALNVDHVQISFSGVALTSKFGCLPDKTGLDVQYFRLKNFNHGDDNPPVAWNFAYTPQVIVINLGQNDQC
ncbi:MAG: sulfonate ABC transporter permease, partial [Armatimonadota bacterium]|nr:sulfonate ABC transporter permease [Armatimonadota bacterium]